MTQLDISIPHHAWLAQKTADEWGTFFENILSHIIIPWSEELSLSLVDDLTIQQLNHQYRHKNKPTNVLSFPSIMTEICLGDVVLSYETIQNEALESHKPFDHHVAHLFVHGVLHLLGHDHIEDDEREVMEEKEIQILKKLKIGNPYVA